MLRSPALTTGAVIIPAGVGAAGTIIRSNGTVWVASTDTWPDTIGANEILHALSANVIGSRASLTFDGAILQVGAGNPAADMVTIVSNVDVTSGASRAVAKVIAAGTGGGDALSQWILTGLQTWSAGADISDSNKWVLSASAALGTTNVLTADSAGNIAVPGNLSVSGTFSLAGTKSFTNSLAADVATNNSSAYFTGPSVAQGTAGTWFASGTITYTDTTPQPFYAKLWDGTTVIASARGTQAIGTAYTSLSLSGPLASPAGNIRISVNAPSSVLGAITFNGSGNGKDSTITVVRIL